MMVYGLKRQVRREMSYVFVMPMMVGGTIVETSAGRHVRDRN